jgi:hypothetical protein
MDQTMLNNDRVRKHTADRINKNIDNNTEENIWKYQMQGFQSKNKRLKELDQEWDIERTLEATSALNVLIGLTLGLAVNKKWFLLSALSAGFMIQHSLQGWCPPLPVFRRLGIRTLNEINKEKEALRKSEWNTPTITPDNRED